MFSLCTGLRQWQCHIHSKSRGTTRGLSFLHSHYAWLTVEASMLCTHGLKTRPSLSQLGIGRVRSEFHPSLALWEFFSKTQWTVFDSAELVRVGLGSPKSGRVKLIQYHEQWLKLFAGKKMFDGIVGKCLSGRVIIKRQLNSF